MKLAIAFIAIFVSSSLLPAQEAAEAFAAKTIKNGDFSLNYRIYAPQGLAPDEKVPLILFLHGAGERGVDNLRQLRHGIPSLFSYILKKNTPAIIIVPQCPPDMQWVDVPWGDDAHTMPPSPSQPMQAVMALLTQCLAEMPVDLSRVYITGISMGGFGTWDFLQREAPLFAAGIPICGGGDTAEAAKLIKTPIWTFHGGSDTTVKTQRSRDMAEAIKQAGGLLIQYTEYPGWGHDCWTSTYANDKVFDWLFDQKKL
jgi:predicted peptidase